LAEQRKLTVDTTNVGFKFVVAERYFAPKQTSDVTLRTSAVGFGRRFDGHPKPTAGSYLIYTRRPETHFHAQSVTFPG